MIKQKAPKDMTAPEFETYIEENRQEIDNHINNKLCNKGVVDIIDGIFEFMRYSLRKPAPNPFTPDQLAVMREFQRDEYLYCARDNNGFAHIFREKPSKCGWCWESGRDFDVVSYDFLMNATNFNDPEPLCFADYAPLEEKQ